MLCMFTRKGIAFELGLLKTSLQIYLHLVKCATVQKVEQLNSCIVCPQNTFSPAFPSIVVSFTDLCAFALSPITVLYFTSFCLY